MVRRGFLASVGQLGEMGIEHQKIMSAMKPADSVEYRCRTGSVSARYEADRGRKLAQREVNGFDLTRGEAPLPKGRSLLSSLLWWTPEPPRAAREGPPGAR